MNGRTRWQGVDLVLVRAMILLVAQHRDKLHQQYGPSTRRGGLYLPPEAEPKAYVDEADKLL